jgi:transposase
MTRYGYNRDGESLPQINIAMLFGEKTRLPVYFKYLPGSIKDVSTLQNLLTTAMFLHMGNLRLVMDKGFYSRKNINDLFDKRMKFTIAIPFSSTFAKEQVERVRNTITDHDNFIQVNDQNLFCISSLNKWEEKKRIYVHVFYNSSTAAADYEAFLNKMHLWENELKNDQLIEDHQKYYAKYFLIRNTPKHGRQISYNKPAIEAYKKNTAGYLVLISNDIKDPIEALTVYRTKDVVEKAFDNLKNSLDMKRLRVHLQENMKGRLFIQFIALILVSYIHKVMSDNDLFKLGSMSCLLKELNLLNTVSITGTTKLIFSEQTKKQREIFQAFGIDPKTYV